MDRQRRARTTRSLVVGLFVLALLAVGMPGSSNAASSPESTIRSFYETLLSVMKKGSNLGGKGRYDALLPAIRRDFDLRYMSRMAIGPAWMAFSAAQKQQATEAFTRYMTATYADSFDSYSGERFEMTGQHTSPYGTIVQSRFIKSDGKPVSLDYLMRQHDSTWQVGDIYLTGTISQLASLRSQFSSVLAQKGAAGLIALLNRKTASLLGATM